MTGRFRSFGTVNEEMSHSNIPADSQLKPNCSCPICPLVEANVNITTPIILPRPGDYCEGHELVNACCKAFSPSETHLRKSLVILTLEARNNYKLPIGMAFHRRVDGEFDLKVDRESKRRFKVSFRTLRSAST